MSNVKIRAVDLPTTYGKEFYACFPINDGTYNQKDSTSVLKLYITPHIAPTAQINIEFTLNGTLRKFDYVVRKDTILTVDIPITMEINNRAVNELKSIHIQSDENITVYGLSHKGYSSDAFLCYPVTALDTMYTVLSSRNEIFGNVIGNTGNRYSGFVIIGTQDGTVCTIVPSCPLALPVAKARDTVQITINKGQTSYINASILNRYDVSGTMVMSNKPIAVYSMHERTFMPDTAKTFDYLVEQTPPITRLSTKTILVPHVSPVKPPLPQPRTFARIAAYFDSTLIYRNGKKDTLLQSGNYLHLYVDSAVVITSDKPILVGQYQESSGLGIVQFGEKRNGDPFMAFIPPVDQFMSSYTVISPPLDAYTEHWINITTRKEGVGRVKVDSFVIPDSMFVPIYDSSFYYIRYKVTSGVHTLQSDTAFGIEMYGYGVWDSYGYIGGMKTERLIDKIMDKSPIVIATTSVCDSTDLHFYDIGEFSSGIDSFVITDSSNITIHNIVIEEGSKQGHVSMRLTDISKDGFIRYQIKDIAGNLIRSETNLKGFTVSAVADNPYLVNATYTLPIIIEYSNTGSFTQLVKATLKNNIKLSLEPEYINKKIVISPQGKNSLPITITSIQTGDYFDTLLIWDECNRMIRIPIHAMINPNQYTGTSFCNLPVEITNTKDISFIANTFHTNESNGTLQIYSLQGNSILTTHLMDHSVYSIDSLSSGTYLFVYTTDKYSIRNIIIVTN